MNNMIVRPEYQPPALMVPERQSDFIDLTAIAMAFRRRLRLFAIVFAILFAAVLVGYTLLPPQYSATSQVAVNTQRQDVVGLAKVTESEQPDTYAVDTEAQVLKSPTLARRVVRRLGLYAVPEYAGKQAQPRTTSTAPRLDPAREHAVTLATNKLVSDLTISRSGLAFVIDITAKSKSPVTASQIVNMLADEYVLGQLANKSGASREAVQWLEQRIDTMRGQVLSAEAAVQRYRAANGLLNTAPNESITQQEMSGLSQELAAAQADLAEKRASAATAQAQARGANQGQDIGQALSSPVVSDLRRQRAQVSTSVADLSARYGPRHPDLLRAREQLAVLDAQIADEVKRIVSGLGAQASIAAGRAGSIQGSIGRARGTLASNNAASVRLNELERNADAVRTLYQSYLARYREISTQQGLEQPDSRIVTLASVPVVKASPKLAIFLALALIAGLTGGVAAITLAEMLDRGLRSSSAIRRRTGLATLATIPDFHSALDAKEDRRTRNLTNDFVAQRPFSAFTESFRMLRAALYERDRPSQLVAITSALPGEGKSTTALCLVRTAALGGESALLIECDTRRRGAAGGGEQGLLEVLNGTATFDNVMQRDEASGAYLMPLSVNPLTPSDVLTSEKMDRLLDELRKHFSLIVLDLPPVLAIAEAQRVAAKADIVAFVVRWGKTPGEAVGAGVRLLHENGVRVAGAVMTMVDLKRQGLWSRDEATAYFNKYREYYS